MRQIKDAYLDKIQRFVPLAYRNVLEVGSGDGSRTVQLAQYAEKVTAVEPNHEMLAFARTHHQRPNILYTEGVAEALPVSDGTHHVVIFTLAFHHVPADRLQMAITEALRVSTPDGRIIFFEPTFEGSFFETEIAFDACDGDERAAKALAYATMLSHPGLEEVAELVDETVFAFDSVEDFLNSMHPRKGSAEKISQFLEMNAYTLSAKRRINIFKPRLTS